MKTMLRILRVLFLVACIAFLLWGFVSWCDIVADNCAPNPQHYDWNMFIVLTK